MVTNRDSPPRRRLAPDHRRNELLDAAERLLTRDGPAVRVEDIVAEARAAKGTFYLYFKTFDDMLAAVRERKIGAFGAMVASMVEQRDGIDWNRLFPDLGRAFVEFVLGLGGLHEVLFHSAFTQARPMPRETRPPARIAAIIRAGQAAGAYADVDPEPTAALLFAAMHEAADAIAAGGDRDRTLAALDRLLAATLLDRPVSSPPNRRS